MYNWFCPVLELLMAYSKKCSNKVLASIPVWAITISLWVFFILKINFNDIRFSLRALDVDNPLIFAYLFYFKNSAILKVGSTSLIYLPINNILYISFFEHLY